MDLPAEALRLVLDTTAVELCAALEHAGVPHVLLKGPSTANWLYDPPRAYRDIDVLVPTSSVDRAAAALERGGLARRAAGRVGEEAPHSLLMRARSGCEIDLHLSLPTLPPSERVWRALADHVETMQLDIGSIPVLDEAGRCLVIGLHALNSGPDSAQPIEDLRRARNTARAIAWSEARALAAALDAGDLLDGALAMLDGTSVMLGDELTTVGGRGLSVRARLYADGAPSAALGLARLLDAPPGTRIRSLWRELCPSVGFMRFDAGDPRLRGGRLALAYLRRWCRLGLRLPAAVRAIRAARRG